MKWQEYEPHIGPKTVLTYKLRYKTIRPYLGMQNVFQTIRNKVKGFDRLAEYLNSATTIEFTYEQGIPVVSFTPNISSRYKAAQYRSERWWAYDYVKRMVKNLEMEPDPTLSTEVPPVVRVALNNKQNIDRIRHLATHFGFEDSAMLTREKLKELKQQVR